jgi:LysM repeat protein
MAVKTYTVKRGDSLWAIAKKFKSDIAGNNIYARIDTLRKLNGIPANSSLIYPNQVLKLSGDSASSSGSGGSSTTPTQATIKALALQASIGGDPNTGEGATAGSGREMYAMWSWKRDNTKNYKYRWTQYLGGKWVLGTEGETTSYEDIYCYSTWTADENATKVKFQVLPVSATYKKGDKEYTYWTSDKPSWVSKEYDFADNPPLPPDTPTVKIEDRTLTASISNINVKKLDAKYVKFNIVKNNSTSVHTSPNVTINTAANYVSYQWTVDYGADYTVRARSVAENKKESGWSEFSASAGTKPSAPKSMKDPRCNKRTDGSIGVYLEWDAVKNATQYAIEYVTIQSDFDNAPDNIGKTQTEDARTNIEITSLESGHQYFFRVRAVNDNGTSEPSPVVSIRIGEPPAAPTTWSSANSAFEGEPMELNWTHNARDGSAQTFAQLSMKIDNGGWQSFTFENTTNMTTGERTDTQTFTYGQAVSYKGELHVKIDTTHTSLKNSKIQWKVRTAGITDAFSDVDWSVDRTIYVYEKPTLALSVTSDLAGDHLVEELTALPFYVRAEVELDSYEVQKPIGYNLRIISNDFYETVDDVGKTKTINPGDAVYSKYFDTDKTMIVEMSASNIDLESAARYTVHCSADMSTGLSVEQSYEFTVNWTDVEYAISANVDIDTTAYTAAITPYCEDANGEFVENITLSVYRREYDGSLVKIASDIPNNGTTVTDPHPALDYARYRLIAKDTKTGAISFYDMAGTEVGCSSVIIQWDEEWSNFDVTDENSVEGPPWSGSMLVLPYNISVSDNRKRDVSLVSYAGRERPVAYHGVLIEESPSWNMAIPKDDMETIYALRRLSLWAGNAYVREPSGMGFWATVTPKFNINYDALTIPVTLEITRVEGGV